MFSDVDGSTFPRIVQNISQNRRNHTDGVHQSSSTILETANIGIKSPNTTPVSTNAATKISKKSRPKERKSLKERSRRQGIQSGYEPGYDTLASSRLFDMCPLLGLSCPTCTDTQLQLPPNFCSLNFIAMKVILISPPMTDAYGRVCGKFGMLTIHGNANIKDFRRLLRFSVQESCGCHLKASRQYYLISPLSAFFREEQLFNKIILTDKVMLISVDRYIDRDIFQAFKECYTTEHQPSTTLSYFSPSVDPQIANLHPIPSNQPQATYSYPASSIQARTANTFPVPPVQLPPQGPTPTVRSLYYDKLSHSSSAPTSLYPMEPVSGSFDGNLSPSLEQKVSSHLETAAGLDEAETYQLQSNFIGCTVPSTCPECYRIETIPDITQHYCASNYAFVAVLKIPDLPPVASLNYTSMCLNLPTNIIYDVSKHIDPKVVVNSITTFLPLMCSGCLANMKGPIIVLLISEVVPAPPATQLDGNFRLFILPVPSTITLPNCDPHYPTLYSFRLNKALQYASPDCPANFEQTCSSCHGYSDAVLAKACEGGFAIVAEIEHAGSQFISQRIPPISVRTTRTYYSKSVEITTNNPPSNKCVQGYLKIIASIRHPLVHLYPRIPFISLPNCGCLPQASSKLLIFSSEPLVLSPAGALHLTKDIHIVFFPTNYPIPKCNEASPILQKPIQRPFTPTLSPPASDIPSLSKHPVDLTYVPPTPPPPVYRYNYLPPPLYITPPSYIFPQASYTSSPKITDPLTTPDDDLVDNWWVDSPGENEKLPPVDKQVPPFDKSLPPVDESLPPVEDILSPEDALLVGETLPPVDETLSPDVFLVDESLPLIDKPLFPLKDPLLPGEEPLPPVEKPLPPEEEPLSLVDEALYVVDESLLPVNETSLPVDEAFPPFFFEHNSSSPSDIEEIAITTLPLTIHKPNVMEGNTDMSSFDVPATPNQGISFVPCLSAEETTCPQTVDETQKKFSDLYCYSKFAFIVAVGFNASYLTKDAEGGELRILTSADPEIPFIGIDYGGKSKSRELTVTVTPAKTMERRSKQPSDETLCYHEKILGLYDLSPESVPRELLQDLDIYIPSSCDSSIFDISPMYGILISEEQPILNNVIQLTEEFVFFPLPEGKLTLPSCHLQSETPITTKYQVQMKENSLPHVICHASGCAKWISVQDEDYTIPCDMKFAALVTIEETSAGKNIVPNLEIFESLSDKNTPLYTLNVIENTEVDTYEDQIKPVQVKYRDGSKYCKYATLKIIKSLFPAAAIEKGEMLTIVAEVECNNPVFKMALFARSTGYHYRNHTCSFGALGTLYDITVRKVPTMALLRVLYSIPPHCSCPALERDGYLLLISEEYIPLTSPLTLQLSKGLHIYSADRGRSLLPGCFYSNTIQARSKILKNMVEMESVDKELHAILPELSYPTCPTIDHTCPKCGGMSDEKLEELICSAEEVLLVSRNKTTAKIPTKPLRTGKTTFIQYENTCTFPLAKGNCSGSIPRFYFDAEDEMCVEFSYSGCNGNANNFQSFAQCEDNCLNEDFCIEGSLSIEKMIKNSYASDYLNNEFIYAFPEHCNCSHMLQGFHSTVPRLLFCSSDRKPEDKEVFLHFGLQFDGL
ncbi:uncharacterized protein TNIN_453381 [Trichonephila inaurata madagascariensis]|uniref:BPTI/Kunitz inhibitor domain-containing protein n=1 Tax=Trichonephila inaurata madagascariensis TaxID=2747483 RepID=A0A8X7CT62_9ARAC|nr:uncharacterized protein TNIN_453381 [Trichonephila inaurata madagascariensis]